MKSKTAKRKPKPTRPPRKRPPLTQLLDATLKEARTPPDAYTFFHKGDTAELHATVPKRILSERDLIAFLKIDTDVWQIEKFLVSKAEAYRKDRAVEWDVTDGKVTHGLVRDSGKLLIEPLYNVKVWLKRRTVEIRQNLAIADLRRDMAHLAPKYKTLHPLRLQKQKHARGYLYEIAMPDIHVGKLTWDEESGESSDLKTQTARVHAVLGELLAHARHYDLAQILLPIGNDFFNVDSLTNTTTGGTPQQEDTRWQKTFRAGRQLAVEMIDMCAALAPVTVLQIPGNHDEQRNFYLGDALEAWYRNCKDVTIHNAARKRKYFHFGNTLLGFTHGNHEKLHTLANIMALEEPQLWASSVYREWHVGDKHHKQDLVQRTDEKLGVVIRILRSLTATDAWHFNKGFVGALPAAEGFLWSPTWGLTAQFTAVAQDAPRLKGEPRA